MSMQQVYYCYKAIVAFFEIVIYLPMLHKSLDVCETLGAVVATLVEANLARLELIF